VNSSVGNGVFVGGRGVKVEARTISVGANTTPAGWNGVGVGEALGFGVTSTIGGGAACMAVGNVQERRIQIRKMDASRSFFMMSL
jgi:hypothetical protein